MAYVGNTPTQQAFTPAVDYFNGTGSATAFTLSRPVASVAQIQVVIENVPQNPSSAYTVSGNTITFTSAPPSGTNNIYVEYTSPITQTIAPGQNTVYPSSLSTTNALYWDTSGNVGIGTTATTNQKFAVTGTSGTPQGVIGTSSNSWAFNIYDSGSAYLTCGGSNITGVGFGAAANVSLSMFTNNTERARFDTTGNFLFNSGYGSVATAYGCRAWANFNGTLTGTITPRASGNVTSVTKNGTGDYTINFTNAMPDVNYNVIGSSGQRSAGVGCDIVGRNLDNSLQTTTAVRIYNLYTNNSAVDNPNISVSIFR